MATLIQTLQNALVSKDPLLAPETKRIILKEVLQAYVLDYLYNHPSYRRLNFYGGTCLHTVYGLNRLSEDLDFDNRAGLDLDLLANDLAQYFHNSFGYGDASAKVQQGEGGILRVTIKFPVLNALGLSPHPSEASTSSWKSASINRWQSSNARRCSSMGAAWLLHIFRWKP